MIYPREIHSCNFTDSAGRVGTTAAWQRRDVFFFDGRIGGER